MKADFSLKEGDLLPILSVQLTYLDGTVVDLTSAASVFFVMRATSNMATPKINAAASVFGAPTNGTVRYTWTGSNTDTVGLYLANIIVNWPGSAPQSFPQDGYWLISIEEGLATSSGGAVYADAQDMLLGDVEMPTSRDHDLTAYLRRASRDLDVALGVTHVVPVVTADPSGLALLRSVTADLASGYYILAQAQAGEDNRVNAYGMHLFKRAWERIDPYVEGKKIPGATLKTTDSPTVGPVQVRQQDINSPVEAFYRWVGDTSTVPSPYSPHVVVYDSDA
jgi:hypothetical protein